MNKVTRICIFVLAIYNVNSCAMDGELSIKLSDYLAVGKVPCDDGSDDCLLWRYELAGYSDKAETQKKGVLHLCRVVGAKKIIEVFKDVVKSRPLFYIDPLMHLARRKRVEHSEGEDYHRALDEIKEFENCTPEYAVVEQSIDRELKIIVNKNKDLQESLRLILLYPSNELELAKAADQGEITQGSFLILDYSGCRPVYNQVLSGKLASYLAHTNKRIGTFVVGTGADGELLHHDIREALRVDQKGHITRNSSSIANEHKTCWIVNKE